jgi:hypothetical protein
MLYMAVCFMNVKKAKCANCAYNLHIFGILILLITVLKHSLVEQTGPRSILILSFLVEHVPYSDGKYN